MADTSDYCALCYGDGWISVAIADAERCEGEEFERFMQRMRLGYDRIACPRCQPNWKPAPRPVATPPARRWWEFWK